MEGTANTRLEILNEWDCMYAWNNKREENHICFAVIWFAPPLFPLLASKGKHVPALWVRENERGSHWGCISCGGEGGWTQIRWQQERFGIFLYYIPSWMSCVLSTSVCRRGVCVQYTCFGGEGGQTKRQKARVLTLIGVLPSSAVG